MEKIIYGQHATEFCEVILGKSADGLCWLGFMVAGYKGDGLSRMRAFFPDADISRDDAGTRALFEGAMQAWRTDRVQGIALDLRGSDFQICVWQSLLDIPMGQVCSYSDLAKAAGRPKAVRAVATAVGQNPVSLLVPCHRVLRRDGGLGNYGWGIDIKKALLAAENGAFKAAA